MLKSKITKHLLVLVILLLSTATFYNDVSANTKKAPILIEPEPNIEKIPIAELQVDPSYSPSGEILAYTSNLEGSSNLCLEKGNGQKDIIYSSKNSMYSPIWSPNGEKIAFLQSKKLDAAGYNISNVLIYDLINNTVKDTNIIVDYMRYEYQPPIVEWSNNSKKLLISSHPIVLWDIESSTGLEISEPNAKTQFASFSPDGEKVAYKEWKNSNDNTQVYDLNTMTTETILSTPFHEILEWVAAPPSWIDNNNILTETEHQGGIFGLSKIDVKNKKSSEFLYPAAAPQISPDKHFVSYIVPKDKEGKVFENHIQNLLTHEVTIIPESTGSLMKWSDDSSKLLLWNIKDGNIVNTKGQLLSKFKVNPSGAPKWFPDSKHVVFSAINENQSSVKKFFAP